MTAPLANVLRHIRTLVGGGDAAGMSDGEILERFVSRRDESAFEELLARHGPMVLGVCQQLLRDPHDAEDAFQATFLVLVRRAGAIGKRNRLAGWLYGVAHRVAVRARAQTSQRRLREKPGVEMVAVEPYCRVAWDDLRPVIHEEVNRLPEKYRSPVVLCYLEGKTQEEAARDLGWTKGTVKGRLERARELLRRRLARRGLALSAGALTAVFSPSATALPPALISATTKAAVLLLARQGLAAGVVSAHVISLTEGVLRTMLFTKLKLAAILVVIVGVLGAGMAMSAFYAPAAEQAGADKPDEPKRASKAGPPAQAKPEEDPKERKRDDSAPRKVQVMRPISRQIVDHQDFTGRTEATKADVFAQASGALDNINFQPGAEIKKGDLLFVIDPRAYQAELDKAQLEYQRAQARVERVNAQLERAKKLKSSNAINEEDFDRISGDSEDAKISLLSARANRELAKLHLESTRVTAPISGQTGRALVTPGAVVKAGTTLLTTIVALEPMHVQFDIDEGTFLGLVRQARKTKTKLLGATVSIGLIDEDGFPHRGTVDFVGNQFSPDTGTLPVRVAFPNRERLVLPGLSVRLQLAVSEPRRALLIPEGAVSNDMGQTFVFVVKDRNAVARRNVEVGAEEDGLREIKEGLAAADWVVIKGLNGLQPGMAVQPERLAAPKERKE